MMLRRTLVATCMIATAACGSPGSQTPAATPSQAPSAAPAPEQAAEGTVNSADGVSIHYRSEGKGPAVVLVHCWGCNMHYWDTSAEELSKDHRVVRLDLAGHGGSGTSRATWTVDAFVGDIRAVVDALKVDKFVAVGHSMSGPIVVETALQLGDRVRGIVPIDSLLNVDKAQTPDARAAFFAKMRADFPGTTEKIVRSLMAKNADPKVVDRILKDELAQDPGRGPSILEATFAYPSAQKLESVKVPIVAIDADLNPVALEANRAHAPQFDAKVMTGVGHWLMLDKPADFAKLLREVVTSIESGAAKGRG